jgi:uncharacterized protein (DUF58 family)
VTLSPSASLLQALGAWTVGTLAVVLLPALWPIAAAVLGALAVLTGLDAWRVLRSPALVLQREVPERAFVGQETWLALRLHHAGPRPLRAEVFEELPRDVTPAEPRFPAVTIAPGEPCVLRYAVRPTRRGDRVLGRAVAFERAPLGLLRRRVIAPASEPLRVYPDTSRYTRQALDPRRVLAELGVKPARRRGDGMEFDSLREYVSGDDPRRLDWAASARRGRPVVRVHRHEHNHAVLIALDASRLMGARAQGRSKLDHAIDAALALAYASLAAGDRVGLAVFDERVRSFLAPRAQRSRIGTFADVLRPVEARRVEADYRALVRELALRQRQRSLVVVLSDFVEAEASRVVDPLAVLARRHRVLLAALRDPVFGLLDRGLHTLDSRPERHGLLYRRLVLDDLLHEREAALATLRRRGIETLDLPPQSITAPVLNRYLAYRYGAER